MLQSGTYSGAGASESGSELWCCKETLLGTRHNEWRHAEGQQVGHSTLRKLISHCLMRTALVRFKRAVAALGTSFTPGYDLEARFEVWKIRLTSGSPIGIMRIDNLEEKRRQHRRH